MVMSFMMMVMVMMAALAVMVVMMIFMLVVMVMMVPVGMVMTMLMIVIVGDMSRYIAVLVHMGVHVGVVVFAAAAGCAHLSVSFARIPNWRGAQKLCLCLHSRRLADTPTSTTRTVAIEHWY